MGKKTLVSSYTEVDEGKYKSPFCPYCVNGAIVKVHGVYICNVCKKQVKIEVKK